MRDLTTTGILLLSMKVSLITTGIIALVGTPVSYYMVRRRNVISRLIESFLFLPLVIPPVVTGYFLLVILGPAGFIGSRLEAVGFSVALDWKGIVVASGVIAFPLYLAVANAVFEKCDKRLEDAARTLNASPIRILFTITLPPALPGLLGAGALAFARAFGEFGATMMLAGNIPGKTRTVPQAIYSHFLAGRNDQAWNLALISISVGIAAMTISQLLIRHRVQIGRKNND